MDVEFLLQLRYQWCVLMSFGSMTDGEFGHWFITIPILQGTVRTVDFKDDETVSNDGGDIRLEGTCVIGEVSSS